MKKIIKYVLLFLILALILYSLYLYPGKIVMYLWGDTKIYSSIFALALLISIVLILFNLIKSILYYIYLLFNNISFSDTLSKYVKHIGISNSIDKEIQINLVNQIKDLKTLKLMTYLNSLIQKKQYTKVLNIIRTKENVSKYKDILNYAKLEVVLASGLNREAKDICKCYLNNNKNVTWAFLKLFELALKNVNKDCVEDFKYLNEYLLHNKLKLSEDLIERVYCIIHYKIAEQEYGINNDSMVKSLRVVIKKFPKFIPGYILLVKYFISIGDREEAIKLISDSWHYNIVYENSILISNIFGNEDKDFIIKEIKGLIKNSKNSDRPIVLLAIVYSIYGDFINVNETIINVKNSKDYLYKIAKLYFFLKENNIKESRSFIQDFTKGLSLSWWNEYLK